MKLVGIAGGSGSGKSTLCYSLMDNYPEIFSIIHLDDYHKLKNDPSIPKSSGMINWDHPDTINWNKLIDDVLKLQSGKSVTVSSWSHRDNKDYHIHKKMMDYTINPKLVVLLEGYLSLWNKYLLKIYNRTYFLDLGHKVRMERRGKFMDPIYEKKILIPMHDKYIEPSKQHADVVINVSESNTVKVYGSVKSDLGNALGIDLD